MKYLIIALIVHLSLLAEEDKIKGYIFGEYPDGTQFVLSSARVQWLGSEIGTLTDNDGLFYIDKNVDSDKLIISFTGFDKDTVLVTDRNDVFIHTLKSIKNLKEVVVSDDLPSVLVDASKIQKTTTITSVGLRGAACCSLSDAFETNPDVNSIAVDPVSGAKKIELLGLHGKYTQLMIELVPFYRGLNIPLGLNFIPGSWLESVSISKGAADVTSGYESTTGQINVELLKPQNPDHKIINFFADNNGRYELDGGTSFQFSENLSSIILLHTGQISNFTDNNNDGFSDRPIQENYNIMNKWFYQKNDFAAQIGFRIVHDQRDAKLDLPDNSNYYSSFFGNDRLEIFAKSGYIFGDNSSIAFKANFVDQSNQANMNFQKEAFRRDLNSTQKSFFSNLIYKTGLFTNESNPDHELALGLGLVSDLIIEDYSVTNVSGIENFRVNELIPGVFAEYRNRVSDKLSFALGFRTDFSQDHGVLWTPRIHGKYDFSDLTSLRISAGKGYRTPVMVTEGFSFLSILEGINFIRPLTEEHFEESYNYGFTFDHGFNFLGRELSFSTAIYRTDFVKRLIYDFDNVAGNAVYISSDANNSNSIAFDMHYEIIDDLGINLAWRYDDVKYRIREDGSTNSESFLVQQPLYSPSKFYISTDYKIDAIDLSISLTGTLYGDGIIENQVDFNTMTNDPRRFDSYFFLIGQVTKSWNNLDFYVGAENITNSTIDITTFNNGNIEYFRPDRVWGPIMGRMLYAGIRYSLF